MKLFNNDNDLSTKKDLITVIREFEAAAEAAGKQVNAKMVELQEKIQKCKDGITAETEALVDFEMNGDTAGAAACRERIGKLRLELNETEDLVPAYKSKLSKAFNKKAELEKVREAAKLKRESRLQRLDEIIKETNALEEQISRIKRELEAKNTEYRIAHASSDTGEIRSIMGDIDPRMKALEYSKQEEALLSWLQGHNIESYFKEIPPAKGVQVTYGSGHVHGYESGSSIPGVNRLNVGD